MAKSKKQADKEVSALLDDTSAVAVLSEEAEDALNAQAVRPLSLIHI